MATKQIIRHLLKIPRAFYPPSVISVSSVISAVSCSPAPRAISYGEDVCHHCKMTVVDAKFAAELVTAKGRVQVFDAAECLVAAMEGQQEAPAFVLVSDYARPGELVNAESAVYLISPQIPSPMGAFLSAFSSESEALTTASAKGGDLLTWEQLRRRVAMAATHDH